MTLLVLAYVPGNLTKAIVFLLLWTLLFWPLQRKELLTAAAICLFFTGMNASALHQGIFLFTRPDVLGMPVYELVMWGFYLTHVDRLWRDSGPAVRRPLVTWALALGFAAAFSVVTDQQLLFWVTAVVLCVAFVVFHEPADFAYAGHMLVLGALIEYVGVAFGEWRYPLDVPGGVPPWFITMWAGIGLFYRRLVIPMLGRNAPPREL
ncbi:hypothetical protein [Roseateles sp. BYS87W]|uniref:Uncharacterized protein n=1 Tax=Pelomonas baiyunensis TaxID=3299026 RepID=A0ABW7GWQ1_9BURK